MVKKNGFTLVELMVVVVIIGVLAAVAIPKLMAAANKAKASEAQGVLSAIANLQAAYKAENGEYVSLPAGTTKSQDLSADATGMWAAVGFDQIPGSKYFIYDSEGSTDSTFNATANLQITLGTVGSGATITINQDDSRQTTGGISALVPNWR